jgi:TRAP-type C4-dicarboxylate transport system permease small subunit
MVEPMHLFVSFHRGVIDYPGEQFHLFHNQQIMANKLKQLLDNYELVLSSFFLCITVVVVIINVALRYLTNGGIFWAEEIATTSFIWSVFIGAAAAYKYKMHIGIDFITRLGPPALQRLIAVVIDALMVIINGYIVYLSIFFIQANHLKRTPVLDIPALYVNLALTTGFTLITLHALRFLYKNLRLLMSANS